MSAPASQGVNAPSSSTTPSTNLQPVFNHSAGNGDQGRKRKLADETSSTFSPSSSNAPTLSTPQYTSEPLAKRRASAEAKDDDTHGFNIDDFPLSDMARQAARLPGNEQDPVIDFPLGFNWNQNTDHDNSHDSNRPAGLHDPALSSLRSSVHAAVAAGNGHNLVTPEIHFPDETLNGANDTSADLDMDAETTQAALAAASLQLPEDEHKPKQDQPFARSPELRVSHKLAERKRRKEMKDLFDELRELLPAERGSKSSKWEILSKAIDYITWLKNSNKDLIAEVERVRRELDIARGGTGTYTSFAGYPLPGAYPGPGNYTTSSQPAASTNTTAPAPPANTTSPTSASTQAIKPTV